MIKRCITKYIYEPAYYFVFGRFNYLKYYSFLNKSQWNSIESNQKKQAELLYDLLDYALTRIPYYKEICAARGITIRKDSVFDDLRKFPILTKDIMKKEFDHVYKLRFGKKWYYNSSGGSTGEPVKLIQDFDFKMKMLLVKKLQKTWMGYSCGDPEIRLWGSERDITKEHDDMVHKAANWFKSSQVLNSFLMDKQKMREYISVINKTKPSLIVAYAQSIHELAKFAEEQDIPIYSPNAVMTSAGRLYDNFRSNIERVFKCPVFDRYGSREVGDIACECEKHKGLHVSMFTHYVEILNKNLQPCREGEIGDIYITLLTNYTMPLIRYKIGDLAVYTDKKCSCGRGLPLIKNVIGRDMAIFKTRQGKLVQGEFFIHYIGVVFNKGTIDKFQVIQKNYDLIEIKVVVRDKKSFYSDQHRIEKLIKKIMGANCKIKWTFVKDILPTKSGKYMYTIREF